MDIGDFDKFRQYRERLRRDYEQVRDRNDGEEDILKLSYLCLTTLVHRFNLMRNPGFVSAMKLYESAERGNPQNLPRAVFELSDFLVEKINEMFDRMN